MPIETKPKDATQKLPEVTNFTTQKLTFDPDFLVKLIAEAYPLLFEGLPRDFIGELERGGVSLECNITNADNYEEVKTKDFLLNLMITRKVDG